MGECRTFYMTAPAGRKSLRTFNWHLIGINHPHFPRKKSAENAANPGENLSKIHKKTRRRGFPRRRVFHMTFFGERYCCKSPMVSATFAASSLVCPAVRPAPEVTPNE